MNIRRIYFFLTGNGFLNSEHYQSVQCSQNRLLISRRCMLVNRNVFSETLKEFSFQPKISRESSSSKKRKSSICNTCPTDRSSSCTR